ncbi:RING finger protein 39-like [Rhineura floridana]|uniref:RING finger protein 39-like n=1 Tax=Rhineura floridana TaxID=261503 RepID=UPI002AC81E5A|nr:RING finger protein 39-like [Rhineura floridana]
MAAEGPIEGLCEEATCSICLEYFIDPVTIDCGHNFCQACFNRFWGDPNTTASCPQCRENIQQRNFRPNRQLANIVELVKELQERKASKRKGEECERHQDALKIFRRNDQPPVGVVRDKSLGHQHVSSISEISEKYKAQLETEKQKMRSVFQRMQMFLKAKQSLWLSELKDLEIKIWRKGEENITELSEELSRLNTLIMQMEGRYLPPPNPFQHPRESLQDIKNALTRCERNASEYEMDISHWWEQTLKMASEKNSALERAMGSYQESLEQVTNTALLMEALNKVNVTLDPETAHPCFTLSEDLKSVRWELKKRRRKKGRKRALLASPERFDMERCVLGREGFTFGRHWWEVAVDGEANARWAVGVARESVRRKGYLYINEGVWAVGKQAHNLSTPSEFFAFTCPTPTRLTLRREPQKIQVSLDYERGQVQFFDADTGELIFTYHTGPFFGERILPFFQVRTRGLAFKC